MSIKSDLADTINTVFEDAIRNWLEEYATTVIEDYGYDYLDKDLKQAREEIKDLLLDIINEL